MELRDLELLVALAKHRHFARAAAACGISQPAFSARIHNFERRLGVPVVQRGNRFIAFTPEGETVLRWAHRILDDADALRQEIESARGSLSGTVTLAAVPTALVFAASAPARVRKAHPNLMIRIFSATSTEIKNGLESFEMDCGITYLDEELPSTLVAEPLYEERYVLIVPAAIAPRQSGHATWREAATLPLCLLVGTMRNRRIIDEIFASLGTRAEPVMETNAFTAALAQVRSGAAATIAPLVLAQTLPIAEHTVQLPLVEPDVKKPIGLVIAERDPALPTIEAVAAALRELAAPLPQG